jgi:hypothetical protein
MYISWNLKLETCLPAGRQATQKITAKHFFMLHASCFMLHVLASCGKIVHKYELFSMCQKHTRFYAINKIL